MRKIEKVGSNDQTKLKKKKKAIANALTHEKLFTPPHFSNMMGGSQCRTHGRAYTFYESKEDFPYWSEKFLPTYCATYLVFIKYLTKKT